LSVLLIVIAAVSVALSYKLIKVETVEVKGLVRQNHETVERILFEDNTDRSMMRLFIDKLLGRNKHIPFVEEYEIEIVSMKEIEVTVYEKSITGYVICMERNWYFDKDGLIVECTGEILEGIPYISGLEFDYVVVDEKLPVENEDIFDKLLDLTQQIEKYHIEVNHIDADDGELMIQIGNVRIELGTGEELNGKMQDLNDLLPTMEDVPGVLDMTVYDVNRKGYSFKKDN